MKLSKLKQELFKRELTAMKISQDLGIHPSQFSLYLNGWREMPNDLKKKVSDYLGVKQEFLFDDYDEV